MFAGNASRNGSGLKPSDKTAFVTPPLANDVISRSRSGKFPIGNKGFGVANVNGRNLVPNPPTSTTACICRSSPIFVVNP
jgi:hypothetical protein